MSPGLLTDWGAGFKTSGFRANYIEIKQSTYHSGTEYYFPKITRQEKWALSLAGGTDVPEKD